MPKKEDKKKLLTFKEFDPEKYINLEPKIENTDELDSEESLDEAPLSAMQRRRRGRVMRKYKNKIAMARKRAKRRRASPEKLKQRARRQARNVIRQRLMKNKNYSEMSPAEKINLDKKLARVPAATIERIAKRLLPQVKKSERERLSKTLSSKNEDFSADELFEMLILEKKLSGEDPDIGDKPGSQPKGYYKGVEKSKKDDRLAHFKKYGKKDDDNPDAYKPAPGDKDAETKPSKYTKKYKELYGEASQYDAMPRKRYHKALENNGSVKIDKRFRFFKKKLDESFDINEVFELQETVENLFESNPEKAIKKKAKETGISYSILKDVFDRGVAAWKTGHRPGTTPVQWGLARINSFATGGKTRTTADKDLWAKHKKNESVSLDSRFESLLEQKNEQVSFNGFTTKNFDLCPGAKKAFERGLENVKDKEKFLTALKAVDDYLDLERKILKKGTATEEDYEQMMDSVDEAIYEIEEAGLTGHNYHQIHLDTVKDLLPPIGESKKADSSNREWGTDSLTKIYKKDTPGQKLDEQSPLMKPIDRGSRVKFTYETMTDAPEDIQGTVIGTDTETGRLRVRDDYGKLYIVKHEDAELV